MIFSSHQDRGVIKRACLPLHLNLNAISHLPLLLCAPLTSSSSPIMAFPSCSVIWFSFPDVLVCIICLWWILSHHFLFVYCCSFDLRLVFNPLYLPSFCQICPGAHCTLWPPSLSISLTGWASWELRLTFQLHFDLWPCCCGLLHLGHNSTCHSPTFHPLCSASHPPITTLPVFSSLFPLSGTYQGYIGFSQSTHTLYIQRREVEEGGDAESAIEKQNVCVPHPRGMRMLVLMESVSLTRGYQLKQRSTHSNVRSVCVRQCHTEVNAYLFDYFARLLSNYVLIARVY